MKELIDELERHLKQAKHDLNGEPYVVNGGIGEQPKNNDIYVKATLALIHDKIEEYLFKIKFYEKA